MDDSDEASENPTYRLDIDLVSDGFHDRVTIISDDLETFLAEPINSPSGMSFERYYLNEGEWVEVRAAHIVSRRMSKEQDEYLDGPDAGRERSEET